jgi:hypothetical protein
MATIVIGKVGKLVLPRASCFNLNLATLFLSTKQSADITARDVVWRTPLGVRFTTPLKSCLFVSEFQWARTV